MGGLWSKEESAAHVNWLESKAAFLALQCYVRRLCSSHILLFMDSQAVITYISTGWALSEAMRPGPGDVGVMHPQENITQCGTPVRMTQRDGRFRIQPPEQQQ